MKQGNTITRIIGTVAIPLIAGIITSVLCHINGIALFESANNWIVFFRAVATVMLTTFALSINLNSGRFDFSIGSISLLSSIISGMICVNANLPVGVMLVISIAAGLLLGAISGVLYIITKLPPIIVSLGVTLLYEGIAFTITGGSGVSFTTNASLTSFPNVTNYILVIAVSLILVIVIFDHTRFGYDYRALMSGQQVAVNTGIREIPNTIGCYAISGALMGVVGFLTATFSGTIQIAINFGSITAMFTAFLPMFIGGFISRFSNDKLGYLLGALTTAFISLMYTRLSMDSSIQSIVTALILVLFLIYLNNEGKLAVLFKRKAGA